MESRTKASAIDNKPYMQVINYRIGRYPDFRIAMLDAVNRKLPRLGTRDGEDYGIVLIEMWAYLADILAYYQERIANEAFIRTAVLRESVIALSEFIDYRLNPGVAAATFIALIADEGKSGVIPAGFRVQGKVAGEPVKIFQTDEAITISSEQNRLKLVSEKPYHQLTKGATQLVLEGTNLNLKVGDWILIIDDERDKGPLSEKWELRCLAGIEEKEKRTTVRWDKELVRDYEQEPRNPRVYVFREAAFPFGSNAPDHNMLAPTQQSVINDASTKRLSNLVGNGTEYHIYLDSIYEKVTAGSYIAAVKSNDTELYRVKKTYDIVKVGFGLSSKVTAAIVDTKTFMEKFKLRETVLLCANEKLKPVTTEIDTSPPDALELEVKGKLSAGAYIAISEEDTKGEILYSEVRRIMRAVPSGEGITRITLDRKLLNSYRKDSAVIYGNVVPATYGEPVKNEILGSGDASLSFQSFTLKKMPVTFLPDPAAPHGAKNSLELSVGGVLWKEKENFMDSGPKDMHYITEINEKDEMSIVFGDGTRGTRLPTGKDNIIARYRKGVGGNADASVITGMVDSSPFLESVLNSVPASGGAGRESVERAKENAPMLLHTFERAVSPEDFAYIARSFSGVAKARSEWDEQAVNLTVALQDYKELDSDVKRRLRAFLDMRRDTSLKLRIEDCGRVNIELALNVKVKGTYFNSKVKKEVERVLGSGKNEDDSFNFFTFERLELGMSIHLSDIYAAVEDIDGVESLTVTTFKTSGSSETIQEHILIKDTEIAQLDELRVTTEGGVE